VYGATKTALRAWSDGLRLELAKFNMHVITLIPGKRFLTNLLYEILSLFSLNLVELLPTLMSFASKNSSSKLKKGWVLQGCKVLGKLPPQLTKNANISGSD
jgi:NAD(P)-dependent dehydrogenase (short-subunit alcohol dehydrogenase family)